MLIIVGLVAHLFKEGGESVNTCSSGRSRNSVDSPSDRREYERGLRISLYCRGEQMLDLFDDGENMVRGWMSRDRR